MFSVVPEPGSQGDDFPGRAQFRLVRTVVIGENLVGLRGGNGFTDGYNPFDLYGAAERARGKALPPHLVFAELDPEDPRDACAFLNAYGPLQETNSYYGPPKDEQREWTKASPKSPAPEEHFRSTLGVTPLLPDPPLPQEEFYAWPLKLFWEEQFRFELALRLHSALASGGDLVPKFQRVLAAKGLHWDIKGTNRERQYIAQAQEAVRGIVNEHLLEMQPRIARVPGSTTVAGVWGCYSLLQAMYLMLFLDIAGWSGRIAQCEKCHTLFYTALDKGKYCSPLCENRARALRAYYTRKGGS